MARILEQRINFEERFALENSLKRFSHVSRVDASPVHCLAWGLQNGSGKLFGKRLPLFGDATEDSVGGEVFQVTSAGKTLNGNWLLFFYFNFQRSSSHAYTWQPPRTTPEHWQEGKLSRCKFCAPCKAFPISLDELGTVLTILIEIFHKKLCCSYLEEEEERKVLSFSAPPCFVSQQIFDFENHFRKIISCSRANECGVGRGFEAYSIIFAQD